MSEQISLAIVNGILTLAGTIFSGVMAYFMLSLSRQGAAAAVKVEEAAVKTEEVAVEVRTAAVKTEEVKQALEVSAHSADKKLDAIHTLVNSSMGAQLKIAAVALRRIAMITKLKEDEVAAEEAELLLGAHEKKQSIVDKVEEKEKG